MHAAVNGNLSVLCIYLIISRSVGGGGGIKALTASIVEPFLQAGRLKPEKPASVWEWLSSAKPVWRQSMEISQR